MPESVKEALRSDGTAFKVVGDSTITAGMLADQRQPSIRSSSAWRPRPSATPEIAQLTNYVAAGGFLLAGSSAFTRNPDGTPPR